MIRALLSLGLMALQHFMAMRQPAHGDHAGANEAQTPGADNPAGDIAGADGATDIDGASATAGAREAQR